MTGLRRIGKRVAADEHCHHVTGRQPRSELAQRPLYLRLNDHSCIDVRRDSGNRRTKSTQAATGDYGYDPSRYATERLWAKSCDGKRIFAFRSRIARTCSGVMAQRALHRGLRFIRLRKRSYLQQQPRIAVGSWFRCCDCACSGRHRARPGLVRRREAHQQKEHVQRLRRCDRFSGARTIWSAEQGLC